MGPGIQSSRNQRRRDYVFKVAHTNSTSTAGTSTAAMNSSIGSAMPMLMDLTTKVTTSLINDGCLVVGGELWLTKQPHDLAPDIFEVRGRRAR